MKKIIAVLLVLVLSLTCLTACKKKTEAVKNVDALIKALDGSEEAVAAAREAYDNLTAEEREAVSHFDRLEKAEEHIAEVKTLKEKIDAIKDSAGTSYSSGNMPISSALEDAEAIREAYEKLSDEDKDRFDVNIDGLDEALDTLTAYAGDAETGAAAYVKAFLTTNPGKEVTAVYCLKQIRSDGSYHFFALDYKDGEETKTVYANARCTSDVSADSIAKHADIFFADKAAMEEYDAKENGNVSIDTAKVLEMAK